MVPMATSTAHCSDADLVVRSFDEAALERVQAWRNAASAYRDASR